MLDYFINAFATLFVTIDPVGLAPMFLAVTAGMTQADRRRVAIRATITAAGILLIFYASGQTVLNVLGISVSAFRVAGGILLFLIAIEMIFGKRQERKAETAEKAIDSEAHHGTVNELAIFPLAIPLISGPATISAIILLSSQAPDPITYAGLGGVIAVILLSCLGAFLLADKLERLLGETAQLVITRLLGVLLAALSVQFVADGILAFVQP
ncbi:MAG: MarC family protein [Roseibium sp.]|uniref:MarC family protein n=1 Tax=Roseibium sp. TaxID=1936156 RepID=UPI001B206FAF|nr:MarC family protein [Roseibium sp.]MBO6893172.1 MarC family protein [Roseibium sp.]MBO6933013.1 MarC family protein [Roseibium sp.]